MIRLVSGAYVYAESHPLFLLRCTTEVRNLRWRDSFWNIIICTVTLYILVERYNWNTEPQTTQLVLGTLLDARWLPFSSGKLHIAYGAPNDTVRILSISICRITSYELHLKYGKSTDPSCFRNIIKCIHLPI